MSASPADDLVGLLVAQTDDGPALRAPVDALELRETLQHLELVARGSAQLREARRNLIAHAWRRGYRNVAGLARVAGVSRDTVYSDLRETGARS